MILLPPHKCLVCYETKLKHHPLRFHEKYACFKLIQGTVMAKLKLLGKIQRFTFSPFECLTINLHSLWADGKAVTQQENEALLDKLFLTAVLWGLGSLLGVSESEILEEIKLIHTHTHKQLYFYPFSFLVAQHKFIILYWEVQNKRTSILYGRENLLNM